MNPGVREGQKNALDHVEWELQEVVSHSVGAGAWSQVLIKQYKAVSSYLSIPSTLQLLFHKSYVSLHVIYLYSEVFKTFSTLIFHYFVAIIIYAMIFIALFSLEPVRWSSKDIWWPELDIQEGEKGFPKLVFYWHTYLGIHASTYIRM